MDKDKKTTIVIPLELWRRARIAAAQEDTGFGVIVIRALEFYLAAKAPKKGGKS